MNKKQRDEALHPTAMLLAGQMGGLNRLLEWSAFFCERIRRCGLKPWGVKGRAIYRDAMNELAGTGGYEGLHDCWTCSSRVMIGASSEARDATFSDAQLDEFLDIYRGKKDVQCEACKNKRPNR